jgi:hypothetical protein
MNKLIENMDLPESKIIKALIHKQCEKKDSDINFVFHLDEIRKRISDEITRINLLFPEYTPHDEKYHLSKLFFIADELLGDNVIESMNIIELFTFSVSLYAHDWGMAISENEKLFILSNDIHSNDICLLDDEEIRFSKFCKENRISKTEINTNDWQDYIRQTHSFRSAHRIKKYFQNINFGIAEIISRLCEGHFVGFEIIDDPNSYPTDYAVLRETINVKALAIYLRLVDLLDLGEDRTPYILWKFVAPRNKFSKMEWSKHRALQPVSFSNYQFGRYIQVDGSTDNHNVYMSILDLKRYVNDQFKQSCDILNRMNHYYHKLNISHIDWRIAARGFKPIPIQFEFDRLRMFEILGDEIYQNDGYVFIRELIQNAVDAIKVRIEVLENKGLTFNSGRIRIDVSDYNSTYYCISIADNGIGMDEYIIRNYLSVAGRSYYNSKDYEKEGFKMEPISRFGIGVLSCFMLSDYIEIETYRDPYMSNQSEKLKIKIPSKENYFRIEVSQSNIEIGTVFHVYLLKEKLKEHKINNFNVIDYISEIAGFVDFPIHVNEYGKKTIINKPNLNREISNSNEFHSISYDFKIESAILPQNISTVKEFFYEKKFFIKEDLKLDRYEGCITYLLPKDENTDIYNVGRSWPISSVKLVNLKKELEQDYRIQWRDSWTSYNRWVTKHTKKSLSINKCESFSVFLNGILLPNANAPEISPRDYLADNEFGYDYNSLNECFLVPQLIVNVPKSGSIKIDLARSTMNDNEKWDMPIWEALFEYIKNTEIEKILGMNNKERYYKIGRLMTFYRLPSKVILERLVQDLVKIPIPYLSKENKVAFLNLDFERADFEIRLPNSFVNEEIRILIENEFVQYNAPYSGILKNRTGELVIAIGSEINDFESVVSIINVKCLITSIIKKHFIIENIEFIKSPLGMDFPWVQEVHKLRSKSEQINIFSLDFSKKDLNAYSIQEIVQICNQLDRFLKRIPKFVKFNSPHSDKLFFSWDYLNLDRDFTLILLKLIINIYKIKICETLAPAIYGEIIDKLNSLPFFDYYGEGIINLKNINRKINDISKQCLEHNILDAALPIITINDFVINSINYDTINEYISIPDIEISKENEEIWGEILK